MILILEQADFSNNNIGKIEVPIILDADAEFFLDYAKQKDSSFNVDFYKDAVNTLVVKLKNEGIFTKLEYLNMFIGTSKQTHALSIVNTATQRTFFWEGTNSPEYSNKGYLRNNKYRVDEVYQQIRNDSWASVVIPESYFNHLSDVSVHYLMGESAISSPSGVSLGNTDKGPIGIATSWTHIGSGWSADSQGGIKCPTNCDKVISLMRVSGETKAYQDGTYKGTFEETDYNGTIVTSPTSVACMALDGVAEWSMFDVNGVFKYASLDTLQNSSHKPRNAYSQMVALGKSLTESQLAKFVDIIHEFNTSIGR